MYVTEILAEYICRFRSGDLTVRTGQMAKSCVLDLLGAAAAGNNSGSASAMRRTASSLFAPGNSSVWFSQTVPLNSAGAALANSCAASALDLDDGHRAAGGHPGAAIIPAAVAEAQQTKATGRDLLTAIVLGYEVAVRVAAARDFAALDTLSTGRWCSYGTAAAGAWLRKLSESQTAQAMAIAGVQSPGLSAAGYSSVMGNHVKEGIPWSTMTGLVALQLAEQGFSGPLDILDHPSYYDSQKILAGLGTLEFALETVYFKPYSCCRWIHSALDALLQIMDRHGLDAQQIDQMVVSTFGRALRLNNYADPDSVESAQYSIPFCLAVAAFHGEDALIPLEGRLLHQQEVVELAKRVELQVDPELDEVFPARVPARVRVETARGNFQAIVENPRGDPANPLSPEDLQNKLCRLTKQGFSKTEQQRLIRIVEDLDGSDLDSLFEVLNKPLSG